jgi:ABC-type multidrug transport system permease subunit
MNESAQPRSRFSDAPFYFLAILAGIGTGFTDVTVDDLLFTALLVLASCMFLGLLRPRQPWRWVVSVVVFIPLTEWVANLSTAFKPTRAQIYGSFLTALPGIAGAYGGSLMRSVIENLRQGN